MSLASRAPLVLAALLMSGAAAADPALLEAGTLTLKDGVASGEGGVRVTFQDQIAIGQRFTYQLDAGLLVIEEGAWTRPEGT